MADGIAGRLERHLRAGSRAPDARIGRRTSVFDLLAADRFQLLALSRTPLTDAAIAATTAAFAVLPATIAGIPCGRTLIGHSLVGRDPRLLQVESPEVLAHYGVDQASPEALVLIRPDGYIAYRSDRLDFNALRAFLRRFEAEEVATPA